MSSTQSVPQISKALQPTTTNTKPNRLPAPTLFVGPPSRNASQISLHNGLPPTNDHTHHSHHSNSHTSSQATKLGRGKSGLNREYTNDDSKPSAKDGTPATRLKKPSEKSLDARWREMQSTLNEVELTAQNTTHVFGASHAAALDELRKAQIALAHAWGRGNEDQRRAAQADGAATSLVAAAPEIDGGNTDRFKAAHDLAAGEFRATRNRAGTDLSASTTLSDESDLSGSGGAASGGAGGAGDGRKSSTKTAASARTQLEEETAQDIRLASERRAANEAYFNKVDAGVREVVAKLEVVAEAMRGVESESRSLWSATTDSSREALAPDEENVSDGAVNQEGKR